MSAWKKILSTIKDIGVNPDLIDQIEADTASQEEREQALSEKDKTMSDMEFQGRAQHQMAKEFPTYSKTYGNRAIYNPRQDLSGLAETKDIKPILDYLKVDPSLSALQQQSGNLRGLGENLAAQALDKDLLKSKDAIDFIEKLREREGLNYDLAVVPNLKATDLKTKQEIPVQGLFGEELDKPGKKILAVDEKMKDDLGTWLHENLHAKNVDYEPEDAGEKLASFVKDDRLRQQELQEAIKNKDLNRIRQMFSSGHFSKSNTLPELYVQDQFEDIMKSRGFETRKDPIKSRFERLKKLMRY